MDTDSIMSLTDDESIDDSPKWTNDSPRRWWGIIVCDNQEFDHLTVISKILEFHKINAWVFQREFSEDGFPHWQITIGWQGKCGMKTIGDIFCTLPIWHHLDVQVTGVDRNFNKYCAKNDPTRVEGPWSHGIEGIPPEPIKIYLTVNMFNDWQMFLWNLIDEEPDKRKVFWFWDPEGNTGKSSFARTVFISKEQVLLAQSGGDLSSRIIKTNIWPKVVIFDFARTQEEFLPYRKIEEVKNGMAVSNKYEGGQIAFNIPHVICFANYLPDESKMSYDRWDIRRISIEGFSHENTPNFFAAAQFL